MLQSRESLIKNIDRLLAGEIVLIDLRSPGEYAKGAFPNSINAPLLDDEQRKQIGIRYKEQGQAAAITLGHQLINPQIKTARIQEWQAILATHSHSILYCWRGGMRSQIVQRWLSEAGSTVPVVPGGYKALRNHCLNYFDNLSEEQAIIVLAGRTGSGKTPLLNKFTNTIDLEGLANHRGSAFGRKTSEQPTTINFEHTLARNLIRQHSTTTIIVEDESRIIGRLAIPEQLFQKMKQASVIVLESPLKERSQRIFQEYVVDALAAPDSNPAQLEARYLASLERIKRRLGGARCEDIAQSVRAAFATKPDAPSYLNIHCLWIEKLLNWYYDPMYDYQLERKQPRVILSGDCSTIEGYLSTLQQRD